MHLAGMDELMCIHENKTHKHVQFIHAYIHAYMHLAGMDELLCRHENKTHKHVQFIHAYIHVYIRTCRHRIVFDDLTTLEAFLRGVLTDPDIVIERIRNGFDLGYDDVKTAGYRYTYIHTYIHTYVHAHAHASFTYIHT
jgi:hypothetical protein